MAWRILVPGGRRPAFGAQLRLRVPLSPRAAGEDLIFSVPRLVAELSAVLPLLPGDVIFTGTPAGVGMVRQPPKFLAKGQLLESWIEGVGTIRNRCI